MLLRLKHASRGGLTHRLGVIILCHHIENPRGQSIELQRQMHGQTWMIYGATGCTGQRIARQAVAAGMQPILAGRNAQKLRGLADELRLPYAVLALEQTAPALVDVDVLLNCAGPFRVSLPPLVRACTETRTHYLDLSSVVPDFLAAAQHDAPAKRAGVMVMPGVGFAVVPTDCVALYLKQAAPAATRLTLAVQTEGRAAQGTLYALIRLLREHGYQRRGGLLQPAPITAATRTFDFGSGPVAATVDPWRGDLVTAYLSTAIPDIETYQVLPRGARWLMRLHAIAGQGWAQVLLRQMARRQRAQPSAQARAGGATHILGEVTDPLGTRRSVRLHGPDVYDFTVAAALAVVARVLDDAWEPGLHTPAQCYGPDLALTLPGVTLDVVTPDEVDE